MKGQCEARVSPRHGGGRCQSAAKHTHEAEGVTFHLCEIHMRVLVHRGHLGPVSAYVERWTQPAP